MQEESIKYCCNFCTENIKNTNGRTFCPNDCYEGTLANSPYGVELNVLETAADPDCESCQGKGHVKCDECSGSGYVTYECDYGVGQIIWKDNNN